MKCPKCGFKMKRYQIQTQARSGYKTDIELHAFRCSNLRCGNLKNIKKKVIPTNALYIEERKPIEKETKELFCCSHMAQAIDKGLFKVISYNTDLARFRYLVFSFIDADFSRSAIIQYCPFCGKKVGIQTKDSIGEE